MELNLKNYTTTLAKDLLKLAGKSTIRECDEVENLSIFILVFHKLVLAFLLKKLHT